MADQKATALSAFTPILTDILYGVDDPGGTPVSGKVTLTAVRDLLQANLTTAVASTGYDISTDVNLRRDAADTLALRRGTNPQTFNIYNTRTDASNYERGFMRWASNALEVGTVSAGTGGNRDLKLVTNGVTRMVLANNSTVVNTQFRPSGGGELGGGNFYWSTTYTDKLLMKDYIETVEATAPASPAANTVRVFAQDNGSGKTQLMALFATGAAQQIAIEP